MEKLQIFEENVAADTKYWVKPIAFTHQTVMKKLQIFEENVAKLSGESDSNNTLNIMIPIIKVTILSLCEYKFL